MSPCSSTWVCASTNPGNTVAFERSMTSNPAGGDPPGVTLTILSPSTRISAFGIGASLFPSIRRPARIAILFAGAEDFSCACRKPLNTKIGNNTTIHRERRAMISSRKRGKSNRHARDKKRRDFGIECLQNAPVRRRASAGAAAETWDARIPITASGRWCGDRYSRATTRLRARPSKNSGEGIRW